MIPDEVPHCEPCFGPVVGRSDLELDLSHIAYWLWMRAPYWLAFSRPGFSVLAWAGNIAFACSCRDKNHAERARKWAGAGRELGL